MVLTLMDIVKEYCLIINLKVLFLSSVCLFLLFLIPSHKRLTDWGGGGEDGDKPPSVRM